MALRLFPMNATWELGLASSQPACVLGPPSRLLYVYLVSFALDGSCIISLPVKHLSSHCQPERDIAC